MHGVDQTEGGFLRSRERCSARVRVVEGEEWKQTVSVVGGEGSTSLNPVTSDQP